DLAKRPAAILTNELGSKALRQPTPKQGAVPCSGDDRPCARLAEYRGAFGEGARQLEVRHVLAIKHDQRREIIIGRRAQRSLPIQRKHALTPLLSAPRPLLALVVEVVDLFLSQALELRAGIFRTAWLHLQDLLSYRHGAGPVLNYMAYAVASFAFGRVVLLLVCGSFFALWGEKRPTENMRY